MNITRIEQVCDTKQLQADLKSAGVQTVTVNFTVNAYETVSDITTETKLMESLLKLLPEPRMDNLIILALQTGCRIFPAKEKAADYLGVGRMTIYRHITKGEPVSFSNKSGKQKLIGNE